MNGYEAGKTPIQFLKEVREGTPEVAARIQCLDAVIKAKDAEMVALRGERFALQTLLETLLQVEDIWA